MIPLIQLSTNKIINLYIILYHFHNEIENNQNNNLLFYQIDITIIQYILITSY